METAGEFTVVVRVGRHTLETVRVVRVEAGWTPRQPADPGGVEARVRRTVA